MKHYLNFKPSIVFRKGSSFMLKTSLMILYGLPIVLVFFWSYNYFVVRSLNEFYQQAYKQLESKKKVFDKELAAIKPDQELIKETSEAYFSYRRVAGALNMSWSKLFETLEEITPGTVMFYRIRIKPDKLVKVVIEGEAEKLENLTEFNRRLFSNSSFMNPMLKRHARKDVKDETVIFNLEVDYLGESGELP